LKGRIFFVKIMDEVLGPGVIGGGGGDGKPAPLEKLYIGGCFKGIVSGGEITPIGMNDCDGKFLLLRRQG